MNNIAPALEALHVDILTLHELPGNARIGDDEAVAQSYRTLGQRKPIVYQTRKNEYDEDVRYVIAGNTQLRAALSLGWTEIAAVSADDLSEEEAEAFALADNRTSELGEYDEDLLLAAIQAVHHEAPMMLEDLPFLDPIGWLDLDGNDDDDDAVKYVRSVESPVYEPTREVPPPVVDLFDTTKRDELLANIPDDMPPDVAAFLRSAAERHTRFSFENIAEYYAHAPADIQAQMEASVLVIIDFDKAVEHGYVKLTKAILEQHGEDYAE